MSNIKVIVVFLSIFCAAGLYSASRANSLPDNRNGASMDSLQILDSLVNHYKISNNVLSRQFAFQALSLANRTNSPEQLVDSYKLLGIAYFQNQKDSSFYYYNLAGKLADDANLKKHKIIILYNLAAIYNFSYNYQMAVTLLDSSVRLAQLIRDFPGISNGYNMLGLINVNIHDYERARTNFNAALVVAREHSLNEQIGVALGNLARDEFEPDVKKSISMQREALNYLKKEKGTEEEMANILINIGILYTNPDSALIYYKSALSTAENAHLPTIIMGAYNNMAYSYIDKGDNAQAEVCVRDYAIPMALKYQYSDWLSSLYDTYADVAVAQGDLKKALAMQKKALKERVADYRQKAGEQVRLLSALLDLKNKELIIQNEEKKLLVQENKLQKAELWLSITALLVIISVFVLLYMQHRNKVKFHSEQIASARRIIEMEESEKGRTSRELHDLTGQLVLGISGMIENIEFSEPEIKQVINERIKDLGASIRQISHRMNRAMIEHFTFTELITGLCLDNQKLLRLKINLDIPEDLPDLSNELVLHFYRILQELLTNAGKYARQGAVDIKIDFQQGAISLVYVDHGPGFDVAATGKSGMGFKNIHERVKLVNGKARVESSIGQGTRWEFMFPVVSEKSEAK